MRQDQFLDWVPPVAVHWGKALLRSDYRRVQRILKAARKRPRHVGGSAIVEGRQFEYLDGASFANSYEDIFVAQPYRFTTTNDRPRIVDCGANIGLSVAFFKRMYPASRIVAFEADPDIFRTLERNGKAAGWSDVTLLHRALWDTDESELTFLSRGGEVGRLSQDNETERGVPVKTCRLSPYLAEPVDLLKLDVEGAETVVLRECRHQLGNVRNIILESHSFAGRDQEFAEHVATLATAGFRIHLHVLQPAPHPLVERPVRHGMDCQVNLFGFRA